MEECDPQTYTFIGAALAVHGELGCGFLEPVYQEALAIELEIAKVPFEREAELVITYRDRPLRCKYRADFVCYLEVIVEVKVVQKLEDAHYAQIINYLKGTGLKKGLLFNFGARSLEFKHFVF